MPSVAVNPPKTPVTKGSNGIATATLPNVCKMPGPPAPFVPTPLPNIGQSSKQPDGYSTSVKIEGEAVAIAGASFGSSGDIASKGTGGGIVSNNAEGPTKFIAPGSLDVQIEGKNVQYLGDQMMNNCGPGGSPANSATMAGEMQAIEGMTPQEQKVICECFCECQDAYDKGKISGPGCCSKCLQDKLETRAPPNVKSEQSYFMPRDPSKAPELLTPSKFSQLASTLQGSRLFNFVSGIVARGVTATAGGSVAAAAGVRLSRALSKLPSTSASAGSVVRPDIVIQRPEGPKVFDAKFRWKNGKDELSPKQARNYKRIDKDGAVAVVDGESCGCP
jgi:hypothetical protein